MAEFLIYAKDHWMDALTDKEIAAYVKKYPKFMAKYNSRIQRGDPVEWRPDGYWTGKGGKKYRKDVFAVIVIKGITDQQAKQMCEGLYDFDNYDLCFDEKTMQHIAVSSPKPIKKRKYNFGEVVDEYVFDRVGDVSLTEKTIG